MKSLTKQEYKKFNIHTVLFILCLLKQDMFMAKLHINDVYYILICSMPIHGPHQKLPKFIFEDKLYKFLGLMDGFAEGPRKFTKSSNNNWSSQSTFGNFYSQLDRRYH